MPNSKRRKDADSSKLAKRRRTSDENSEFLENLDSRFGVKFDKDIVLLWNWLKKDNNKSRITKFLGVNLNGVLRYLDENKENGSSTPSMDLHLMDRDWGVPPEFQPCFRSHSHIYGFWRDVPSEVPVFVVKKKLDDTSIAPTATDLLDLIRVLAVEEKKKLPQELEEIITSHSSTRKLRQVESGRKKNVVAKCFNKIGIVVPVKNDIGYRPLIFSYNELDSMLRLSVDTDDDAEKDKILSPFDECINYIQFANDEGDYGMGFELAMCLLSHQTSSKFIGTISSLLPLAYRLLGRELYGEIIEKQCELKRSGI